MNRSLRFAGIALLLAVLLGGCAYPNEQRLENKINPAEFITVVQQAVDQYHDRTGVLPIKNSEMDTPLYEKYVIDFGKLQKANFLTSVPANAFESGGIFMYVLVHAEEAKPEVKLLDLAAYRAAGDIQKKADAYKMAHNGEAPVGIQVAGDFYYVDFDKLNMKAPEVKSAFNRQSVLNYIVHRPSGAVAIDYGPDLMKLIESKSLQGSLTAERDLRELLASETFFVPAPSFAYRWSDGQPLPALE